jgi:4-diphosphocytidyl-2C-methyl-D-erythritol kinase
VHTIAAALERVDRAKAGRILEAKQPVEAGLLGGGSATLAADLRQLFAATRAGLRRLDVPVPDCS